MTLIKLHISVRHYASGLLVVIVLAWVALAAAPCWGAGRVLFLRHNNAQNRQAEQAISAYLHGLAGVGEVDVGSEPTVQGDLAQARRLAEASGVIAVMWTEATTEDARLWFFRSRDGRTFERRVGGKGAARLDQLGIVARAGMVALLENTDPAEEATPPQAPAVPAAEAQQPQPAPPRDVDIAAQATAKTIHDSALSPHRPFDKARLLLGYVGASSAHEGGWRSGVAFGAAGCPWRFFCVTASYAVMGRDDVVVSDARARVTHRPLDLALELRKQAGVFTGFVQAAGTIDFTERSTLQVPTQLQPTANTAHVQYGLLASGGIEWQFAPHVALRATMGAETSLAGVRYNAAGGEASAPQRVRPRAGVALTVGLW